MVSLQAWVFLMNEEPPSAREEEPVFSWRGGGLSGLLFLLKGGEERWAGAGRRLLRVQSMIKQVWHCTGRLAKTDSELFGN